MRSCGMPPPGIMTHCHAPPAKAESASPCPDDHNSAATASQAMFRLKRAVFLKFIRNPVSPSNTWRP